ncbi:MAG: PspC family transcriptional regulator, partial [Prevotella sp.]|nr:PspC family transcriptional regulator [Prevotella sp.]
MKKNININLCGRLFNIDEDAYELLKNYMDTLHNYFKGQIGGDEIADDIEQRIAELLDELKANGIVAINIDHIKNVINRIGQPEQMDNNEEKDHEEQAESASFVDEDYKERKGMD